jgi:hypothetical protein
MDNACREATHRDGIDANDLVLAIEHEDEKMLAVSALQALVHKRRNGPGVAQTPGRKLYGRLSDQGHPIDSYLIRQPIRRGTLWLF